MIKCKESGVKSISTESGVADEFTNVSKTPVEKIKLNKTPNKKCIGKTSRAKSSLKLEKISSKSGVSNMVKDLDILTPMTYSDDCSESQLSSSHFDKSLK